MPSPNLDDLPDALSAHIGYLLVRLGKHAQRLFSQAISPLGLRPAHCDILLTLADRGAMAQVEIADLLLIERAHLVALLDQLEALGLVQRAADRVDRRRHAVTLTEQGVRTAAAVAALAIRVEDALLAGLAAPERPGLRSVLRSLARDADEGD